MAVNESDELVAKECSNYLNLDSKIWKFDDLSCGIYSCGH